MCLPVCCGAGSDGSCCLCGIPCNCFRDGSMIDRGPVQVQPGAYY